MTWDGTERRREQRTAFCEQHIDLTNTLAKMETSLINIEKTIEQGISFKNGMIVSLIGIFLLIVIQTSTFAFLYGKLVNQVGVNTLRLSALECKIDKDIYGK